MAKNKVSKKEFRFSQISQILYLLEIDRKYHRFLQLIHDLQWVKSGTKLVFLIKNK
jgi:hypothetical protein